MDFALLGLLKELGDHLARAKEFSEKEAHLDADAVAAWLTQQLKDWHPKYKGLGLDEPTRAAGLRFLAGLAVTAARRAQGAR